MMQLEAHGLEVAYVASRPILKDVSFTLTAPGFYGLVGANGAGKTTLLRALMREVTFEGSIRLPGDLEDVIYCPQTVDELNEDVRRLGESDDGSAYEIRGRLDLSPPDLERWSTLSPGERKRWQIGGALAREPDVLLLDEPTNHLDVDARDRLIAALRRFRGIGIIVSHDRAVLEKLPRAILRVHDAGITMYTGGYSEAKEQWEGARRAAEDAHSKAKATVKAFERRLDDARRTQEAASRSISTRTRMKDKNDSDARGMLAKNLARWAEARAGRTVQVVRGDLARAKEDVPTIERDKTIGGKVFATYARAPQSHLFHLDAPELRAGPEHVVLRDVRLTIGREERLRLAGPNGAGKTTLLHALLKTRNNNKENDPKILFLPQELAQDEIEAMTRTLREDLDAEERGRVMSIFAALGSDPERVLGRDRLEDAGLVSPGEARKLALALGLGRHAWALVLDEPTNHLDLPTIEKLEAALTEYPGCIVLITHDDAFARRVTTRTLVLDPETKTTTLE